MLLWRGKISRLVRCQKKSDVISKLFRKKTGCLSSSMRSVPLNQHDPTSITLRNSILDLERSLLSPDLY